MSIILSLRCVSIPGDKYEIKIRMGNEISVSLSISDLGFPFKNKIELVFVGLTVKNSR